MQILDVRTKRKRTIGLTPLIDIVFILLIFFILETTLIDFRTIDIDFPVVDQETKSTFSGQTLTIEVFDENRLWVSGTRVDISQLPDQIDSINPKTIVRLVVADEAPLQLMVDVLGLLDENDFENVSIGRIE